MNDEVTRAFVRRIKDDLSKDRREQRAKRVAVAVTFAVALAVFTAFGYVASTAGFAMALGVTALAGCAIFLAYWLFLFFETVYHEVYHRLNKNK